MVGTTRARMSFFLNKFRKLGFIHYKGRMEGHSSRRSARMPRSEERGGMAAHSEAEANSLLVYKSPAWKGGVLYSSISSCTTNIADVRRRRVTRPSIAIHHT